MLDRKTTWPTRLVLGGHSFIPEMGNDPATDFATQLAIVNTCLDSGIGCFDTTWEPERLALGHVLQELGRRDEAQIIAWNFFTDPITGMYVVGPSPYRPSDIDRMLSQLRTNRIDFLVVHPVIGEEETLQQLEVARSWLRSGYVGSLGTWDPPATPKERFGAENSFEFMVAARNVAQPNSAVFQSCKEFGWRTFATSPFNRGWLLDELIAVAVDQHHDSPNVLRARLSDALIRFSIHSPDVDHLIIGIRKTAWIDSDLRSVSKGPLSPEETHWLLDLTEQVMAARRREQGAAANADKPRR